MFKGSTSEVEDGDEVVEDEGEDDAARDGVEIGVWSVEEEERDRFTSSSELFIESLFGGSPRRRRWS
jgi:hypothetical protein